MVIHHRVSRTLIAVLVIAAMVLGIMGAQAPKAQAVPVQPTGIDFSLTDPNGQTVGNLAPNTPYKFRFEFTVPDGTQPGDHFTVTLPPEFSVVSNSATDLGGGTAATVNANEVTVTFGEGIGGLVGIRGGFEIIAQYNHTGTDDADVNVKVTLGNETLYEQVHKGAGPPPAPPMAINKWSGYSTAPTNVRTATSLKLQTPRYNYQWINPVEGQVFAHWFIELNNWHGENPPANIGQDIVITDRIAGMPAGFTPGVKAQEEGSLTQAQLDEQLNGYYLQNFVSVAVRDNGQTTTYPALNSLGQTLPFITFTGDAFEFRVSEYLASIGVTPSDTAQYAINYYTLVPAVDANVTNTATMISDEHPNGASDSGWYQTVDATGWIYGEQPTTSLKVTKEWVDWDTSVAGPTPAVQFELLADGQPARDLHRELIPALQLGEGATEGQWDNLPTQSARNVPIVYSVKEVTIEGYASEVSGTFTTDLTDLANIPAGAITVTNTKTPDAPMTSIIVTKVWEGLAAGEEAPEVAFTLLATVEDAPEDFVAIPAREAILTPGNTTARWDNLPVQTEDGRAIIYKVEEVTVPGFTSVVFPESYTPDPEAIVDGEFIVTNTKTPDTPVDPGAPVTELTVEKIWEGVDAAVAPAIAFTLLANGSRVTDGEGNILAPVTLQPGTTTHTWDNLPAVDADGEPIEYSVIEAPLNGYDTEYSGTYTPDVTDVDNIEAGTITVTNTKDDESEGPVPGSSIPWWPLILIPLIPLIGGSSTSSAPVPDSAPTPTPQTPDAPTAEQPKTDTPDPKAEQQRIIKQQQTAAPAKPASVPSKQAPQRTLANTGAETLALGALALALVIGGAGVLLLRRRNA
ncbi:MAG: Cna B-type domain-containing protein [Corynebacterium sp.]|uniref:Cna B-type domain-containing protein n=1 Tax=Corynebacterium sp. TaxID=1720 RepID=UPI0026E00A25|nr:Cna B-type domain-containing protein [Corynebacterium sp.]MDO5669026.1 Cna B-type domain-containing protein [Corynebacterium sp.]